FASTLRAPSSSEKRGINVVYVVPAASIAALETRRSFSRSGLTHVVTVPVSSSIAAPLRKRASYHRLESRALLPSRAMAGVLPLLTEFPLGVHASSAPSSVAAAIPPCHGQPGTCVRAKYAPEPSGETASPSCG